MKQIREYKLRRSLRFTRQSSDQMTPWDLAVKMVDQIPEHLFNKSVLIPGSGFGTFALALVYRGWSPDKITCVEIDPGFALVTSKRSSEIKTIRADFLIWEPDMKFDVVIGNPPYSLPKGNKKISDGKKNLALQFIEKSVEVAKEGGYVSMITPPNFLKPTDSSKSTRAFSSFKGLNLKTVETGVEKTWFPGINTKIILWSGTVEKGDLEITLNSVKWDLEKIPFVVDLEGDLLEIFKKVWHQMKSGPNPVVCRRVGDGDLEAEKGWSLTERLNRRKLNDDLWSKKALREKYEQIHINRSPEIANSLFQTSPVRFFMKATDIEPTFYHNLVNGLDLSCVKLNKKEQEIIEEYIK